VKQFFFHWLVGFTVLFVLFVPFPYAVLPSSGELLRPITEPLVQWLGDAVFQLPRPYTARILSDSTGLYLLSFGTLVFSGLLAINWMLLVPVRRSSGFLWYWFHTAVCYFLALQLLKYGVDKLFKHQFYLPEPNTLFTPLGYLSPDLAYWSVLGTSRGYSLFTGALEVAPALLLFFGRTRLLGAVLALVVLGNVVAINFAFDISVKLHASFLLLLSLVAAWPALQTIYAALVLKRWQPHRLQPPAKATSGVFRVLAWLVAGLFVGEALVPFLQTRTFNDDQVRRPWLHGAYALTLQVQNGDTIFPAANQPQALRRLFIHRQGYLITQSVTEQLHDYRLTYAAGGRVLLLRDADSNTSRLVCTRATDGSWLQLRGTLGPDSVNLLARSLAWQQLPLLEPGFHWTTDGY